MNNRMEPHVTESELGCRHLRAKLRKMAGWRMLRIFRAAKPAILGLVPGKIFQENRT
jgi:hypothetical protein